MTSDQSLRIVFAGTPQAAVPSLHVLAAAHDVVAVVTRPAAPLGRKRVLTPSPVAQAADARELHLITAKRFDDDVTAEIETLAPDLGVIVAYGGLVREPLLQTPRLGWINLHFSLLPAWRGAAPVQRAIQAGDTQTGVSVFQLVRGLDAGDVFVRQARPLGPDETAADVLDGLADLGAQVLADVVAGLADGTAQAQPQEGEPSLAPKLTLDDARIDWQAGASAVYNRIRAVTPEPGAFTLVNGSRVKVLRAAPADAAPTASGRLFADDDAVFAGTGDGALELLVVQPAGKRAMPARDWWRGLGTEDVSAE